MNTLKIEQVKPDSIQVADYNPRRINDKARQGLTASIKKFGLTEPLIINKKSGRLVSGHQRLSIAKELMLETVPVVFVELSDIDEKALNVAMNSGAIQGVFTDELQELLKTIHSTMPEQFGELNFDELLVEHNWDTDLDALADIEETDKALPATIKITCPQDLKDEVLIYIKAKLLETSFEGVHVE